MAAVSEQKKLKIDQSRITDRQKFNFSIKNNCIENIVKIRYTYQRFYIEK